MATINKDLLNMVKAVSHADAQEGQRLNHPMYDFGL